MTKLFIYAILALVLIGLAWSLLSGGGGLITIGPKCDGTVPIELGCSE